MIGKIRQKLIAREIPIRLAESACICPICEREIDPSQRDAHHLIPKSKGGKRTEYLHRICHRQIHAIFTETELATQFNTAGALKEHIEMQKFIAWVKSKPIDFYEKVRKSARIKNG